MVFAPHCIWTAPLVTATVDVLVYGVFQFAPVPCRNTIGGHTPTPEAPLATTCPDDTTCPKFEVPETFELVMKVALRFEVDNTLIVDEVRNGIVTVSKLNIVFDAFDVKPAVNRLVVVRAFEA